MSPIVSVILPTHDRAARLPGAMAAVLAQTIGDLELIVVDDGSSDATPRVVEEAMSHDPRVRGVRLETSSGPSAARNAGLRIAAGEFLAFTDDDDRWAPTKTEVQLEYLRTHPTVIAAFCHYERFDERSGRASTFRTPTGYSARALLWSNFPGSPSLGIVRRSLWPTDQWFDESLPPCEDWDCWITCADYGEVVTVPQVLCRIVFHGDAQSAFDIRRRSQGAARFIEKYEQRMTSACLAYHKARLRLTQTPRERDRFALHLSYLARLPRGVRRIVALETLAARAGRLIADPALGHRLLLRLVEKTE